MKSQEVNFQKSQKLACLSGWEFEADKSRYGGLRNPPIEIEWIAIEYSE